ncbi:reverse transcriptase domain-containing protein [Tanacetum coccineum]
MITPVEKRNVSKFCEFHGEVGHTTDECMHLKRQIKEMLKVRKLSHLIKELKQNNRKDQAKTAKKGEPSGKDKPLAILMDKTEGPMIIEAEIGGYYVHRMYVDGGSSSEILYEHCFNRFHPEVRNQMVLAVTPLVRFSEEIIWPLWQISLLVKIGDEKHSTSAWMNFMVVRSPSPYNGIIGRPRVAIHPEYPEQTIAIGSTLTEEGQKELCELLRCHLDVFAWKPADMTGVPRHVAEHRLNIHEGFLPVRQKKRGQAPERNKAIHEEVEKLVDASIMKEVHYHSWLSNPVMVKKHDDNWRMCVDFKDLNKACPKDGYPLPEIDWKVESLCGYPFKCFLDAYKGYHQIKMAKEDEENTAFTTSQGIFCYLKMSFVLKNAGATYQRLVDKAFQKQIGRNLKVYVDDLVIKSQTEKEVIRDIEETFRTLREINMKLNPKKYAFGMREGIFLGYKVDADRLRVCPDKVEAVLNLPSPRCLKECKTEIAFKQMKQSIAELSMLAAPTGKEELIMYLTAAKEDISAVLMTEIDGKQVPIYFVSRALQGPEINYTPMEKLILALVSASKRLKRSRTSVKGQILADFIIERPEDDILDTPMEEGEELPDPWVLFTDGSSCVDGSGAGLIITNPEGMEFTYALRFGFNATNNEAEYEALIAGLRIAGQMGV